MNRNGKNILLIFLLLLLWIIVFINLKRFADFTTYMLLHLKPDSHLASTMDFFVFEVPKVMLLLVLIIFVVGIVRSYFSLPAAGKTGTTQDFGDAWFVGFTPQLSAGIWVGFDDNRIKFGSADGQGGRAAAPIFGIFMRDTYEDPQIGLQPDYFHQPDGIVTDTICVETKKKARPWCPEKTTEIFNAKYPIGLCDLHTSPFWREEKNPNKVSW